MKTHTLSLSALILAAAALPLAAQTATTATHPVHHTPTTSAHHATTAGCVKLPELSSKIPALPTGLACAKPLYTLTHIPDIHLDYASPLVSPELRAALAGEKTTYSLDYVDTVIGTGELAQPKKYYTVHYTGYLADGTKFDSSVDRGEPISFPYGQRRVIPGWDTGFEGMHVGGKRRLYIPYELAYGEAGRPPVIPAKAELVFDVEFVAQGDEMPKPKTPPTPPAPMHPSTPPQTTDQPAATPHPATPPTTTTPPPASTTPPPSTKPQQ
jgi:peptidylprolyl isomerase